MRKQPVTLSIYSTNPHCWHAAQQLMILTMTIWAFPEWQWRSYRSVFSANKTEKGAWAAPAVAAPGPYALLPGIFPVIVRKKYTCPLDPSRPLWQRKRSVKIQL